MKQRLLRFLPACLPTSARTALLGLALLVLPAPGIAATLDAPHDDVSAFAGGCTTCHDMAAYDQPNLIPLDPDGDGQPHDQTNMDDTLYNTTVCCACHLDGGPATGVMTHSSIQTDASYGDWTVECVVCHNQHKQEQDRKYGTNYGKFIRTTINLAGVKDDLGNSLKSGRKSVRFIGTTGSGSFADGDATYDGICEVCHTQTSHYRNDGGGADQNHAMAGAVAQANGNLTTQQNCVFCHNHEDGFRPSCPDCHGFPPTVATVGGPGGLAGPGNVRSDRFAAPAPTGSTTNGQHVLHATSAGYNYPCQTCHQGGMSMTMTADDPKVDNQIQIGFSMEQKDSSTIPAYSIYKVNTSISKCYDGVTRNCGLTITATGQQVPPYEIENFVDANLSDATVDGTGTHYDGQSGITYQGMNNTTATSSDTKRCSNVYCHTDGKTLIDPVMYAAANYPPRYAGNISPPWDNPGTDPQGDGFKCNNCHDYPPRYDSHQFHYVRNVKCDMCHFGIAADSDSDGTFDTISDRTKHANGRVDIIAATQFWYQSSWHPLDIAYIPKPGGGTCINRCHSYINFSDPKTWGNRAVPTSMNPTASWTPSGNQQCSTPGMIDRAINLNVFTGCSDCVSPFYFRIDWGDGNIDDCSYNPAQDPPSPDCRVSSTGFSHMYRYDINSESYPDRAYDISWTIEDAEGIPMTAPDPRTTRVVVCPQPNTPPEFFNNNWTYAPGPDGPARDLTVTVTARDLDFNTGSHAGPALITIEWGDFQTEQFSVNMDNTWQSWNFTHVYSTSTWKTVRIWINDNAPEEGNNVSIVKQLDVDPTVVTCKAYTCP